LLSVEREGQGGGAGARNPKNLAIESFRRKRAQLIDEVLIVDHAPFFD
jgi:hypothetical protein